MAIETKCFSQHGQHYRGTIASTDEGNVCENWSSHLVNLGSLNLLHRVNYKDFSSNYCRNPFGSRLKPWCYIDSNTTDSQWQYCNVPMCKPPNITDPIYPLGSKSIEGFNNLSCAYKVSYDDHLSISGSPMSYIGFYNQNYRFILNF